MPSELTFTAIVDDPDGTTRFHDGHIPVGSGSIAPAAPPYEVTDVLAPNRMVFTTFPPEFDMGLHPGPRRQFLIVLAGGLVIETSRGESRTFGVGDVLLIADTGGPGHRTRPRGDHGCSFASVALADGDPVDDWLDPS